MAQLVSSRNLFSSGRPLVVGAVSSASMLEGISQTTTVTEDCDVLELRLDSIQLPVVELHAHAAQLPLPVLITARHPHEGGDGQLSAPQRESLLRAHLDVAALMDVELRSAMELAPVIKAAQSKKIGVIGSFHDFNSTPNDDVLRGAIEMGLQFRFDAIKIATMLNSPADLARLVALLGGDIHIPLIVMGMGSLGRASRLVLAKCGSVLNYGFLGESNAPGQWPARRLKELLREL